MHLTTPEKVPYRLHSIGDDNSYYPTVRIFCDKVIRQAQQQVGMLIAAYSDWSAQQHQPKREPLELQLELLALGVYWRLYGRQMQGMSKVARQLLSITVVLRQRVRNKYLIDKIKGTLLTHTLAGQATPLAREPFSKEQLQLFLCGFAAVGDFVYEAERMRYWAQYLNTLAASEWHLAASAIYDLAIWFANASTTALSSYTRDVESYRQEIERRGREDILLCQKQQLEYHLNMVGAEMLNRAYRQEFLACRSYELLIPGCMRVKSVIECPAKPGALGKRCVGCT